ncbi:DUF928 domain-containing protein [Trichothermofontia sp.]
MGFHPLTKRLAGLFLISVLGATAVNLPAIAQRGMPGRRVVGGTRGGPCFPDYVIGQKGHEIPVLPIALVPENGISLTTSAQPTIFWYQGTFRPDLENFRTLPKTEQVHFQLVSQRSGETVYATTVMIPKGQPGIYSVTLPPDAIALAVGEAYNWRVNPICSAVGHVDGVDEDAERNIYWVGGTIQRVAANTEPVSGQAGVKALAIAKNGIWNDALTTLAAAACERPDDPALTRAWTEMLTMLHLEADGLDPNVLQIPTIARPQFACP